MSGNKEWCLYVLDCADQSFYIGITTDIEKRPQRHQEGKGGKYTRSRLPVKLASYWRFDCDRSFISKLEMMVKSLNHSQRLDLIQNSTLLEEYIECIECVKLPIENCGQD